DQYPRSVRVPVVESMGPLAAGGTGHHLPGRELALGVETAQGRAAGKHDDQLLVCLVAVQREARSAGRDLVERGPELLGPGLVSQSGSTPSKRGTVEVRIPVWFVDVRHDFGA